MLVLTKTSSLTSGVWRLQLDLCQLTEWNQLEQLAVGLAQILDARHLLYGLQDHLLTSGWSWGTCRCMQNRNLPRNRRDRDHQ